MNTTLNQIRKHSPCAQGWSKLLANLGKTKADDEPLSIITILNSNGLDGALWCLRAVENEDKKIRLFAVWCARQVQHLMKDERSIKALDVSEAFANGNATQEELTAARVVAWAAAVGATYAAADADSAWADAAWAAYAAAADYARAAVDAVGAAMGAADAAWADARYVVVGAAAARVAAADYARDASANAAWDATRAARDGQETQLRRICGEPPKE